MRRVEPIYARLITQRSPLDVQARESGARASSATKSHVLPGTAGLRDGDMTYRPAVRAGGRATPSRRPPGGLSRHGRRASLAGRSGSSDACGVY